MNAGSKNRCGLNYKASSAQARKQSQSSGPVFCAFVFYGPFVFSGADPGPSDSAASGAGAATPAAAGHAPVLTPKVITFVIKCKERKGKRARA